MRTGRYRDSEPHVCLPDNGASFDDLADPARTDNFNHPDMILQKSQHVAGQNKACAFNG
jgi:hypothetical protein